MVVAVVVRLGMGGLPPQVFVSSRPRGGATPPQCSFHPARWGGLPPLSVRFTPAPTHPLPMSLPTTIFAFVRFFACTLMKCFAAQAVIVTPRSCLSVAFAGATTKFQNIMHRSGLLMRIDGHYLPINGHRVSLVATSGALMNEHVMRGFLIACTGRELPMNATLMPLMVL